MAIIWCGGEDIDFPNGAVPLISTNSSYFRSGYARCCLYNGVFFVKSSVFSDISSGWCSAYVFGYSSGLCTLFGLADSSTNKGIFLRQQNSVVSLASYNGSSYTTLATESGASCLSALSKFDIYFSGLGNNTNIKVYCNGVNIIDWTGDLSGLGISTVNSVYFISVTASGMTSLSEFIVADEDTRLLSLVIHYPSASGDINDWTGTYGNIDETTKSDADIIYDGTENHDAIFNLSNLPTGNFAVKAVKVVSRAACGSGSPNHLKLGIKSNNTTDVDTEKALETGWKTIERLMNTNPTTSAAFTTTEIDALQVVHRTGS